MELKRIRVSQALLRKNLFMGGERELSMSVLFCWLLLMLVSFQWIFAGICICGFAASLFALRRMARKDYDLSKIYLRHIRYKAYYRGHGTPFS